MSILTNDDDKLKKTEDDKDNSVKNHLTHLTVKPAIIHNEVHLRSRWPNIIKISLNMRSIPLLFSARDLSKFSHLVRAHSI